MKEVHGSPIAAAAFVLVGASLAAAQTPIATVEDLRRALAPGDRIAVLQGLSPRDRDCPPVTGTVPPAGGQPVSGRLVRLGTLDFDVRPDRGGAPDVTIRFDDIRSLERRKDPSRNGAFLGAGIGAGTGAALFTYALVVDRNEMDEWTPAYAGLTAASTGIGALIGWAIDAAHSKPHIRFDAQPVYSRSAGAGASIVISISR